MTRVFPGKLLSIWVYTAAMGLPRHPQVAGWLRDLDDAARGAVDEALDYLQEHGRAAALPDVRHRIQSSRHFPHMSEVRVDIDNDHVYRLLVGFGTDDVPALLLAGTRPASGTAGTRRMSRWPTSVSTPTSLCWPA